MLHSTLSPHSYLLVICLSQNRETVSFQWSDWLLTAKLLLALASTVILGCESHETDDWQLWEPWDLCLTRYEDSQSPNPRLALSRRVEIWRLLKWKPFREGSEWNWEGNKSRFHGHWGRHSAPANGSAPWRTPWDAAGATAPLQLSCLQLSMRMCFVWKILLNTVLRNFDFKQWI
jgi:hypothetical protein